MIDTQKIKVIGFDLDQTLYPKSPAIDEAIREYFYPRIAKAQDYSIGEARSAFKELYDVQGLGGGTSLKQLGVPEGSDLIQEALENADLKPFLNPDVATATLLQDLRATYDHIDIVTGSAKKVALEKLDVLEISTRLFGHIITNDDASKSDRSAFELWLGLYSELDPSQFLYIGDRASTDYDIPTDMGMQAALVYRSAEEVSQQPGAAFTNLESLRSALLGT